MSPRDVSSDPCEWFSSDDILAIAADAYFAEGVDYPLPDELITEARSPSDGNGCEWTVDGTLGGWGRTDFTVSLLDHSDIRFFVEGAGQTGPTHLEGYKTEAWPDAGALHEVEDLVPDGIVFLGGFTPGFDVYVESVDRILDFRHDLSPPYNGHEDYRVEVRMLTSMLRAIGWIP